MTKYTLATLYGAGLSPFAPGTMGSIVAAILAYPMLLLPYGWALLTVGVVISTILGTRSATNYMRDHDVGHDPSEVVVDELAGQWLTYVVLHWCILFFPLLASEDVSASPKYLLLGFVLFRIFDITKPWPIRWADRNVKGGFGVMFDDLLAAIPAGLVLYVLYVFRPAILG